MPEVKSYFLTPTALIPNSSYPLLHYPGLLAEKADCNAAQVHDLFAQNGWDTQWIYRYGPTQTSHYHSQAHECMAVLTGSATIRFGVADLNDNTEPESAHENGGVELHAQAGDVFVIPAGISHKTFNTSPATSFKLLTPGDGHHIASGDPRTALASIELSGFTMVGAYPKGSAWDSCSGGEHAQEADREKVWAMARPKNDPVLGNAAEGLCSVWQ